MSEVRTLGVVGAGTMGAGIAQIASLGGFDTLLHDPMPDALAGAPDRIRAALDKGAERGRWTAAEAKAALERLRACERIEDLAPCDLVIEAAPEDLELKRELFGRLSKICGAEAILATNTSSLPVTAMAGAAERPEQVVGMHFFNPPALMELVEIVAGDASSDEALQKATEAGRRMGRTPIRAADGPGFLANRVARPFGLEALRLLDDGIASHEQIDRICRIGGGFRMGPFELMDLVGVDVGFEVSKSFWEQSFHEPRWQPHPIQERMVQAGRLGRKAGRGYYEYGGGAHRPEDPKPPEGVEGAEKLTSELDGEVVEGIGFKAIRLSGGSLAGLAPGADAVGFVALPNIGEASVVELTRAASTSDRTATAAETFFTGLGKQVEWIGDAPGGVLGRIICQLINEAAFAVQKEVGAAEDVDTAMRLGFNHPRGPFEWANAIGAGDVLTILDGLWLELREERYRPSPWLRRLGTTAR